MSHLVRHRYLSGLGDNTAEVQALQDQAQGLMLVYDISANKDPALRSSMLAMWQNTVKALPWAPQNLPVLAASLWDNYGMFSYPTRSGQGIFNIGVPAILTVDDRAAQWANMYDKAWKDYVASFLSNQMGLAKAQGAGLAANTAMWNLIATYSGADYLEKVWADFWAAVDSFKSQRDAAATALQAAGQSLTNMGTASPSNLLSEQSSLEQQVNTLIAQAKSTLGPLGATALQRAGLGIAPLVIAGITAAVVVAITASVWAIAHEMAAVQKQANDHAQEVWAAQTVYDEAQAAIGNISQAELASRRGITAKQMTDVADAQGAAALGKGLSAAGSGLAMGVGAVALAAIGILYLWNKRKS